MKRTGLSILLLIATVITNCGPKMQEKQRDPVTVPDGGQESHEVVKMSVAERDFVKENKIAKDTTLDSLKQLEFMLDASKFSSDIDWSGKALAEWLVQDKQLTAKKVNYGTSAYLDLVFDQIRSQVSSVVNDTDQRISADTQTLIAFIRKEQKDTLKITADSTLKEKLDVAQKFLTALQVEVKKVDILPEFKDTFISELKKQSQNLLADSIEFDNNLVRAKTLTESLTLIRAYVDKTSAQLSSEDQASLASGLKLAGVLDQLKDAESGLQALALVWTLLEPQQRIDYFQASSAKLYDFLNGKSADDIQCMIDKNCHGLKTKLVLNIGVYPAIEKFGLQNIADLINQKGLSFITQKVNQVALTSLQSIGETITDHVLSSVSEKKADLGQFKDNLRDHLADGLEKKFSSLNLKTPQIFLVDAQKTLLDFDTQTVYLRDKIKILPLIEDKNKLVRLQFEVVEGLIGLQLYSQSLDGKDKVIQSDLSDLIVAPGPRQYLNSTSKTGNVNLKQQSELLATTSLALNQLADWKTTTFDSALSQINAGDILTQFKTKSLDRSFFPKSDLVAVALSVASQVLKQMQSESSPLVLVNNQNQIISVQKLSDSSIGPIALAAATDFAKGVRVPTVSASDLSELLMAMVQFYEAIDQIEQTQSDLLKKPNADGHTLLEELTDARQSVRLLIVATANFISNQLIQSNGLISKSITLNENLTPLEKYELLDQTRSVEALVHAYETTQIDVYLWTAKNIYHSMNQLLYSDKIKFYQQNTENEIQSGIDATKLLETYKNLLSLKKYLDNDQQTQFEDIFRAWLKG